MAGAVAWFWEERGPIAEGRRRLEWALAADDRRSIARANALGRAGIDDVAVHLDRSEQEAGDDRRHALEFAAQFRSRSFNNTLLIFSQHNAAYQEGRVPGPVPTYVAGFKQWLKLKEKQLKEKPKPAFGGR